jgi:hypothetical protein
MALVPQKVFIARLAAAQAANAQGDAERAIAQATLDASQFAAIESLVLTVNGLAEAFAALPQQDPAIIARLQEDVAGLAAQQTQYSESLVQLQAVDSAQAATNAANAANLQSLADELMIDDGEPTSEPVPEVVPEIIPEAAPAE